MKDDRRITEELMLNMHGFKGMTVGIAGPPGVGKSTFIEALGIRLLNDSLIKKLAVLAIDPSSPSSGGAILGDKTRMQSLSAHPNAFIRPSPSKGTFGGICLSTSLAINLCLHSGHDLVLVETIGIGQSETMIVPMVDVIVLLVAPDCGDDLQGIKKGITELADVIVVNKADNPGSIKTAGYYRRAVQLQDIHRSYSRQVLTYAQVIRFSLATQKRARDC